MTDLSHELDHAGGKDEYGREDHDDAAVPVAEPVRYEAAEEVPGRQKDLAALHYAANDAAQEHDHDAHLHKQLHTAHAERSVPMESTPSGCRLHITDSVDVIFFTDEHWV